MGESNKKEKIIFDGPTRGLLGLIGGLAVVIMGISVRTYFQLPKTLGATLTTKRKLPSPSSLNAHASSGSSGLRVRAASDFAIPGWRLQPDKREPSSVRLVAVSGAVFEQKILPSGEGTSARAYVERMDARLSKWGQEYQRIRLGSVERSGLSFTRLEYSINLRGEPTQRILVLVGRLRVTGKRRLVAFTLGAPEGRFEQEKERLKAGGIRL